jgi:rhodanese-related sulfurtransferase
MRDRDGDHRVRTTATEGQNVRMSDRPESARSIDQILAEARGRIDRVGPAEALREAEDGAILVDIRPAAQRAAHGSFPVGIVIERNVLEWRFDPQSDARIPEASGYDVRVIVACQEGYTSSLAAAALQDLGLTRATDLEGGFDAWQKAGLPTGTQPSS